MDQWIFIGACVISFFLGMYFIPLLHNLFNGGTECKIDGLLDRLAAIQIELEIAGVQIGEWARKHEKLSLYERECLKRQVEGFMAPMKIIEKESLGL